MMMKQSKGFQTSITSICTWFDISRQGYYKSLNRFQKRHYQEAIILELTLERRKVIDYEGYVKTYKSLKPSFNELGFKIGRDKYYNILRDNNLLMKSRRKYARTTNSYHHFRVHKNLIMNKLITRPDQVYVSDITYIRVQTKFMYLSLITDVYSRKIVGYNLSHSLGVESCIKALKLSLKNRVCPKEELIHHSDRGIQYCCKPYVQLLKRNGIKISMAEAGNCYENAIAERVNGILKGEFQLDQRFMNEAVACKAVKQAVSCYNEHRLHRSLNFRTPNALYAA